MGYWQTMGLVIVPQAIRRMVPAIVSQLVTLIKDSSLGVVIGYEELMRRSQITGEFFDNTLQALFVAAVIYIVINYSLSRLARRLEVRQRRRYKAGAIRVTGVEDLAVVNAAATRQAVIGIAGDMGGGRGRGRALAYAASTTSGFLGVGAGVAVVVPARRAARKTVAIIFGVTSAWGGRRSEVTSITRRQTSSDTCDARKTYGMYRLSRSVPGARRPVVCGRAKSAPVVSCHAGVTALAARR